VGEEKKENQHRERGTVGRLGGGGESACLQTLGTLFRGKEGGSQKGKGRKEFGMEREILAQSNPKQKEKGAQTVTIGEDSGGKKRILEYKKGK